MSEKPRTAGGYRREETERVRSACLTLATVLGDLVDDIVVVGGLVPVLWQEGGRLHHDAPAPIGTVDVDVGIDVSLLEDDRFLEIAGRLRRVGFAPDRNVDGNPTPQRWIHEPSGSTIDFLIEPNLQGERAGRIKHLDGKHRLGAILASGIDLAHVLRIKIRLTGETLEGETASRDVWVCDAAAFVVLKAIAFRSRGERKDAYDLFYALRNSAYEPEVIAEQLGPHRARPEVAEAVTILREDFTAVGKVGPSRAAAFLGADREVEVRADVVGFVGRFLRAFEREV